MKKIAFVHDVFPGGGAERVTLDIAEYLSQHRPDYQCYVLTPHIIEELNTEDVRRNITIIPIQKRKKDRSKDVERLIVSEKIDLIVQVVQPVLHIRDICKRTGCKSIFSNHGEPLWERYSIIRRRKKSIFFKPLWKLYWKHHFVNKGHARNIAIKRTKKYYSDCDAYTVLCKDYKQEICQVLGIRSDDAKIHVIENSERIVTEPTLKKEKIIMFCGRLENTSKRIDRLLRIWGRIQHRLPDYKLLIVGDGNYRKNLELQIANEKLERVEMVGKQADVAPYYRSASIVCLTSQTEGWPLCLTEAQAHGCIPIAFGCTAGVRDILSPSGANGFIVTPFDEEEYAETLVHIAMMTEDDQNAIRQNAISKRSQYAPEIIMKKWAVLFDRLLNSKQ